MAAGLRVLGLVDVVIDGRSRPIGRPQVRHLLALLAVADGRWVTVDTIEDDLWPGASPRSPRAALNVIVARARDALGEEGRELLVSTPDAYRLDTARCETDLRSWEEIVGTASQRARAGDLDAALEDYAAARGLWRGDAFSDVHDSALLDQGRRRLHIARTDAELAELNALVASRRFSAAATLATALLTTDHLREDVAVGVVRAFAAAGLRAEALRTAARYRTCLREELGVSPSPAFDETELAVLVGEGPGAVPAAATVSERRARRLLVGRAAERQLVDEAVDRGLAEPTESCVVVRGEAGMGVTAFLRELVQRWSDRPSAPAVQHVTAVHDEVALRPLVGLGSPRPAEVQAGELVRAVEALAAQVGHRGLVLVVDDADDLDEWSTRLVVGLAARPVPGVVLVLGRHERTRPGEPVPLDVVERQATVVSLLPLDRDSVFDLLRTHWPDVPRGRLQRWADHLHRWCGGNPLWTEELLDVVDPELEPSDLKVPPSVDATVRRRLAELPQPAGNLLRVAAVLGAHVDPQLVASVADVSIDAVVAGLSQTLSDALARPSPGNWGFRHEVVRQAIAATVAPAEATRWHAAAGHHLAGRPGRQYEAARHLALAVPLVDASIAHRAALDAASELRDAGAYAEAARHYGDAARLADDDDARVLASLEQADLLERVGDRAGAAQLYDEAVASTVERGAVDLLVRAALGGTSHASAVGGRGDRRSRLRIAWRRIDPTDARAADVAVELALELVNSRQEPDEQLLDRVRQAAADPTSTAHLLARRFLLAVAEIDGAGSLDEADRLVTACVIASDVPPHVASACLAVGIGVALADGAWSRAEEWIDELAMLGTTSGEARARWQSLAFRSVLLEGRGLHAEADQAATTARDVGEQLEMSDAAATFALHQLGRAHRSGSLAVLAPGLAIAADRYRFPVWSTLRGLAALDAGATSEAQALLDATFVDALGERSHLRAATLATATLLAARLADRDALDALEPALGASAGRLVLLGYGGPCLGPVDWYRAEAATARGRAEEAAGLTHAAVETCRRAGAWAWVTALRSLAGGPTRRG